MGRGVELFQFVGGDSPAETIVCVAREAAVRHGKGHGESGGKEHVRDAVENDEALRDEGEGSRREVGPADAAAIEAHRHEGVADAHLFDDIAAGRRIDHDGEGRALIHAVELSGAVASPEHAQRAEGAPGRGAIRLLNVSTVVRCFLRQVRSTVGG